MTPRPGSTPAEQVLRLLGGKILAQAVSTAAELRIPDVLADGPMTAENLAEHLRCDSSMLDRLLTVLYAEGVFDRDDSGCYSLTPVGRELIQDRLGPLATFLGSADQWAVWGALCQAIQSGKSAFELTHGVDMYQWLDTHPHEACDYDRGIDVFTAEQAEVVASEYDFSGLTHIVDVGGGRGTMLLEILTRWPQLQGTLFDVERVVRAAEPRFAAAGLTARCRFVAGSFFDGVPQGGDAYLIKHILHNWDDVQAHRILVECRQAMPDGGRLLIVEGILPPGRQNTTSRMMDLEMMALFARGRERTKLEFRRLLASAGFRMNSYTAPLGHFARLLTAQPIPTPEGARP